jgi:hypothetical protein
LGRYLLAWFPMILIAVANGALREAWLVPRLGEHAARQVSTLLLVALLAIARPLRFRPFVGAALGGIQPRRRPPLGAGAALGRGRAVRLLSPVARLERLVIKNIKNIL